MKRFGKWLVRQWNQNIVGISPKPEPETWPELRERLDWGNLTENQKRAKRDRLKAEFNDETTLMLTTFNKLIGMMTSLGIIFAILTVAIHRNQSVDLSPLIVPSALSIILAAWGLSTRFKVMKKAQNSSLSALMVDDGNGEVIKEELAADIWWWHNWKWHRYNTRLAIDRIFLWVCLLVITTASVIGFVGA